MARAEKQPKQRSGGGVLAKVLIVVVLAAIGLQLHSLRHQVQDAEAQRDDVARQVQAEDRESVPLAADIAEGATDG